MFENLNTRDCTKCIHHISGNCTKWDCEMETLEQFKQRVQAETKSEILQIIREGEPTGIGRQVTIERIYEVVREQENE